MGGSYPPFYADDRMQLYQAILAGKIEYPRHIKKEARSTAPTSQPASFPSSFRGPGPVSQEAWDATCPVSQVQGGAT